jgi:hypothetical protein
MRTHRHIIRIGNVRIDPQIITAYMPLWTEGRITGVALYTENRTDAIRIALDAAEALEALEQLDGYFDEYNKTNRR